jgi:single-stranded DNA-binding protein
VSGIETAFFGSLACDAETKTSRNGKPFNDWGGEGDGAQRVNVMAFNGEAIERPAKFEKGARVYVEGTLRLEEWTGQDGAKRHGLSCMAWHCRLAAIGRNRPSKSRPDDKPNAPAPARCNDFHDDPLPSLRWAAP